MIQPSSIGSVADTVQTGEKSGKGVMRVWHATPATEGDRWEGVQARGRGAKPGGEWAQSSAPAQGAAGGLPPDTCEIDV